MVNVSISKGNHDLTVRELKYLEVLWLNLAAQANAYTIKEGMALNPLEKQDLHLFNYQFAWQHSITRELYEKFIVAIQQRYNMAFKMCDLEDLSVNFLENAYLEKP